MPIFENTFIAVYVLVLLFIFGTIFASFIACTAGRVLAGVDWVHGHSHCDTCGHELAIGDLFPIVSFIALKGKCRYCGARVPISCLFTEVLLGVAFVLTAVANPYIDAVLLRNLALEVILLGISLTDIWQHKITNGFLFAAIAVYILTEPFMPNLTSYALDGVVASVGISAVLLIASTIMEKAVKKTIIGGADLKLFAVMFLFTGLWNGLFMLILTCLSGLIGMLVSRKKKIALAPFISGATVFVLLVGDYFVNSYLTLIGG